MWLQKSWNDDVSILQDIISENECHITELKSEEAKNKFSLDINE